MNTFKAVFSGAIIWGMIFCSFFLISIIPGIQATSQGIAIAVLVIPYAVIGSRIYFSNSAKGSWQPPITMVTTALILDALITVPFFEKPLHQIGHLAFFSNPLLWVLVVENLLVIYGYWFLFVRPKNLIKQ